MNSLNKCGHASEGEAKEFGDVGDESRTASEDKSECQGGDASDGSVGENTLVVTLDGMEGERRLRDKMAKEDEGDYDEEGNGRQRRRLHQEDKEEEKGNGGGRGEESEAGGCKDTNNPSDMSVDALDIKRDEDIVNKDPNTSKGGSDSKSSDEEELMCEKKMDVYEGRPEEEEESQQTIKKGCSRRGGQKLVHRKDEAACEEDKVGGIDHEDDKEMNTSRKRISSDTSNLSLWRTVSCSAVSSSALLTSGTIAGFTSVTLPQLTDPTSTDLTLAPAYAAIFASVINLGAAAGGILGIFLMVYFGQRKSLLLLFPCVLGLWMFIAFTTSPLLLVIARGILGIGIAISESAGDTFVAEFAHCKYRGRLLGVSIVVLRTGACFVYILGSTGLTWRQIAVIIGTVTSIPTFLGLLFLHDSPRWLMRMKRPLDAAKALQFFRGPRYNISEELKEIESSIVESTSVTEQLKRLTDISILKRLVLFSFFLFLMAYSGSFTILIYAVTIFRVANASVDAFHGTIILGVVKILGGVAYLLAVDLVGRRLSIAVSFVSCGLSMASFAVYFYIQDVLQESEIIASINWLPLVSLMSFMFFLGYGEPVAFLLVNEVLPNSFRSSGFSIIVLVHYLGGFSVSYAYPPMSKEFGTHGAFAFYTVCCVVIAALPYVFLPETKGKTLEEIEKYFKRQRHPHEILPGTQV